MNDWVMVFHYHGFTACLPPVPPRPAIAEYTGKGVAVGAFNGIPGPKNFVSLNKIKMPCRKRKKGGKACARRKKVIRKNGKRYYRAGKSGLVRLKGAKKAPRVRR